MKVRPVNGSTSADAEAEAADAVEAAEAELDAAVEEAFGPTAKGGNDAKESAGPTMDTTERTGQEKTPKRKA